MYIEVKGVVVILRKCGHCCIGERWDMAILSERGDMAILRERGTWLY